MGHVRRAEVQRSKWKKRTGKERTHLEVIKERGGGVERGVGRSRDSVADGVTPLR